MKELGLIHYPAGELNIYTLSHKGRELALTFAENITDEANGIFWECIDNGIPTDEDLAGLMGFALHKIPPFSQEHILYQTLLLDTDNIHANPTFHRKNTLKLLLSYLQMEENGVENAVQAFLKHNYLTNCKMVTLENETTSSWYLYEINELLHVAFEHFHACFLYSLEIYPLPLQDCIESLLQGVSLAFKAEGHQPESLSLKDYYTLIKNDGVVVHQYYREMEREFKAADIQDYEILGKSLYHAINTLLAIYRDCHHHLSSLKALSCSQDNHFYRNGYAGELIEDIIKSKWDMSLEEYVKTIILLAINQHTFTSYGKTRIGQALVHNYMIEDDMAWRLRDTLPSRTSPRLQNVMQYLIDLGWLSKGDKKIMITALGTQILTTL